MWVFLGNFLWFIFGGGFFLGLTWFFYGLLWCITIVGIPIGIACFRVASFAFFPFGKQLVPAEIVGERAFVGSGFVNVLWVIFSGFWLALGHIILGVGECCTVIGIPFGLANFKIAQASFAPLGKRIVSSDIARAAYAAHAQKVAALANGIPVPPLPPAVPAPPVPTVVPVAPAPDQIRR